MDVTTGEDVIVEPKTEWQLSPEQKPELPSEYINDWACNLKLAASTIKSKYKQKKFFHLEIFSDVNVLKYPNPSYPYNPRSISNPSMLVSSKT
ncbi:MAG: hypothetical protein IPJ79_12150 [Bacteroidetes bacterium]|nr:hypothetical protein [Bacteroidota bacterium]HNR20097.1 hypothetical protein [Bacteroidia bacterium]